MDEMLGDIMKCIGEKYTNVVLAASSPSELWTKLESQIVGEKLIAIAETTKKMNKLKFKSGGGKLEDHVLEFKGLITKYQQLGGKLSESELAEKLLESMSLH